MQITRRKTPTSARDDGVVESRIARLEPHLFHLAVDVLERLRLGEPRIGRGECLAEQSATDRPVAGGAQAADQLRSR